MMNRRVMQWLGAGLLVTVCTMSVAADEPLRVGRYTQMTGSDPNEMDPLAVMVQIHFPREVVVTVGDALNYLLQRTGYSVSAADPDAEHLMGLPLPESQRVLGASGPRQVKYLARNLVGDAFGLCVNARSREIAVAAIDGGATCLSKQLRGE